MAQRGTEWHPVWERFGQFPLQQKRLRLPRVFCVTTQHERLLEFSKSILGPAVSNRSPFQKEAQS